MIDRVKKLFDITFKSPTDSHIVVALCSQHVRDLLNAFMRALADAARERVGDKAGLEHRVKCLKYRVMQDAVAHRCFVDVPQFRVGDIKSGVGAVLVGFISQITMQLKNMLFQILLKVHHIVFAALVLLELVPRVEQVLGRSHVFKYSLVRFHI